MSRQLTHPFNACESDGAISGEGAISFSAYINRAWVWRRKGLNAIRINLLRAKALALELVLDAGAPIRTAVVTGARLDLGFVDSSPLLRVIPLLLLLLVLGLLHSLAEALQARGNGCA